MPLDPVKVGLAVQGGLSIVCATCKRYWEGRERGLPEPSCTTPRVCGSPLAGMAFPEYAGPISVFDRWCFVCGQSSKYGVKLPGRSRVFGLCAEHVRLARELRAHGMKQEVRLEVVDASGRSFVDQKGPKSLAAAIFEVEQYFAKDDG